MMIVLALKGDAATDMVDLAQIDGNLQLIRILREIPQCHTGVVE